MFTGVPGSGKTTLMSDFLSQFEHDGITASPISEYRYVKGWSKLPDSQPLLQVPGESFVLKQEGYWTMSAFVAKRLAEEIEFRFFQGDSRVVFEAARGVGEPRVDYAQFTRDLLSHLDGKRGELGLVNIEAVAGRWDIEQRIKKRFMHDRSAPPPGTELRYLRTDGLPLCYSTQDLREVFLGVPLVFNEIVHNGSDRETLRAEVVRELYPRLIQELEIPGLGLEGGRMVRGPER